MPGMHGGLPSHSLLLPQSKRARPRARPPSPRSLSNSFVYGCREAIKMMKCVRALC